MADEDDDWIFRGTFSVRAMSDARGGFPAKDWFQNLKGLDRRRAEAGLSSADIACASKRGFAGRIEKVEGSDVGLRELKLTRGGTPGPQLRMLGLLLGGTFWAAHGFTKTSRKIKRNDVATAERRARNWRRRPNDDVTRGTRRKKKGRR